MATAYSTRPAGLNSRGESQFVRKGLEGRTIYFPPEFLAQHDQRPGQLVEVLSLALSRFMADEKGGVQ